MLICRIYVAVEIVGIGSTSPAAIVPGKAFFTLGSGINIALLEHLSDVISLDALKDIAHDKVFITHELMTWIKISPGRHAQIFTS